MLANIVPTLLAQHVGKVCSPCWRMLVDVGECWYMLERVGQFATCCGWFKPAFTYRINENSLEYTKKKHTTNKQINK